MDRRADRDRRLIAFFKGRSGVPRGILFLLFLVGWIAGPALAEVSLTVVPPYVEKLVAPGSKVGDALTFRNDGDTPVVVSVDFADFAVDERGEVSDAPPGSKPSTLLRYLRISPLSATVAPGQSVFFRYSVTTPEAFDQLRAMVYFTAEPQIERQANQVLVITRMGVPIYVENRKEQPAQLRVDRAEWEWAEDRPDHLQLELDVLNEGGRNLRPEGFAHVESADGSFSRTFALNEGRAPVLPGSKRQWLQFIGPVPRTELTVTLRLATSARTSFRAESRLVPGES